MTTEANEMFLRFKMSPKTHWMVILSHNVNSIASMNKFFTSCTVHRYCLFETIVTVYNVLDN